MDEILKFKIETANKKAEEFGNMIDKIILYQIILMFTAFLFISKPEIVEKLKIEWLLNLDGTIVLKIIPFLLFFLFIKMGLSLKRYFDLRNFLDKISNEITNFGDKERILLFSTISSSEMFYSIHKYPELDAESINGNELVSYKYVGLFHIRFFSLLFAFFIGVNNSLIIWLFYQILLTYNIVFTILSSVIYFLILYFSLNDFIVTSGSKSYKKLAFLVIIMCTLGLLFLILKEFYFK